MNWLDTLRVYPKLCKIDKALKIPYLPPAVRRYLLINRSILPGNQSGRSESIRYIAFDTETTGLNPGEDRILSIGALAIYGNSIWIEDSFYRLIQYKQELDDRNTIGIHGILPGDSLSGDGLGSVIMDFLDYIRDSILVAHHSDFDIALINRYLRENYSVHLLNPVIDTAILARRIDSIMSRGEYIPEDQSVNLDVLAEKYKISNEGRHNALGDSYITGELFLKLTAKMIRIGKNKWKNWTV